MILTKNERIILKELSKVKTINGVDLANSLKESHKLTVQTVEPTLSCLMDLGYIKTSLSVKYQGLGDNFQITPLGLRAIEESNSKGFEIFLAIATAIATTITAIKGIF